MLVTLRSASKSESALSAWARPARATECKEYRETSSCDVTLHTCMQIQSISKAFEVFLTSTLNYMSLIWTTDLLQIQKVSPFISSCSLYLVAAHLQGLFYGSSMQHSFWSGTQNLWL